MPKILIYRDIWIFIIYPTDMYEKRKHIHVGKKSMINLCKIWLEPSIEISKTGELSSSQLNEVLEIAKNYKEDLLKQWDNFVAGKPIQLIKVK